MEEEMTEEVKKEEVHDPQALLAAYKKAKEDLVTLRGRVAEAQTEVDNLKSSDFRLKAIAAEAKLAIQGLGIKNVERLMPYIGTEGLDFDTDGNVTGLKERLEALKKDLPEIFDAKRRAGGKADIYADDNVDETKDPLRESVRQALTH